MTPLRVASAPSDEESEDRPGADFSQREREDGINNNWHMTAEAGPRRAGGKGGSVRAA